MKNVLKVSVGVEPEIPSCLDSAPSLAVCSNVLESQKLVELHFVSIVVSSKLLTEGGYKGN